jgi:hypothetical protein
VADVQPSQIRIGDTERESALTALGEHMSAGRLDIDEYGDRTARVSTAKTRGELIALFDDLPQPHPRFGTALPPPPPATPLSQPMPQQQAQVPAQRSGPQISHRIMSAAVPIAGLLAVALFFTTHLWFFFLIPAAVVIFGGAIFGDDWKNQRHHDRDEYRRRQRDMRRGRRW